MIRLRPLRPAPKRRLPFMGRMFSRDLGQASSAQDWGVWLSYGNESEWAFDRAGLTQRQAESMATKLNLIWDNEGIDRAMSQIETAYNRVTGNK